jgi:predicted secreted hydrolase
MRLRELLAVACLLPGVAWPAQLGLESVLGETAEEGFLRADHVREFVFPDDHGPHEDYRSEWWYVTVNLRTREGREFGVQFTAFRQALRPPGETAGPWNADQVWLAHFAVTDVAARRHHARERMVRGHPRLAGARATPFAVWVDGWRLETAGDTRDESRGITGDPGPLRLDAAADTLAVTLRLEPAKPVVLQGDQGLSAKGPGQASYYYSLPRLSATGTVSIDGRTHPVAGRAWLDREWSTSVLSAGQVGWDWFGLHFDDGEDLMVFRLRREDGQRDPYDQGMRVRADGTGDWLQADAFGLTPLRVWRDERGVEWPVAWRLLLRRPDGERVYRIEAAIDAQRMDTLLTYWEGLVHVHDAQGRRVGAGYMELTGYE